MPAKLAAMLICPSCKKPYELILPPAVADRCALPAGVLRIRTEDGKTPQLRYRWGRYTGGVDLRQLLLIWAAIPPLFFYLAPPVPQMLKDFAAACSLLGHTVNGDTVAAVIAPPAFLLAGFGFWLFAFRVFMDRQEVEWTGAALTTRVWPYGNLLRKRISSQDISQIYVNNEGRLLCVLRSGAEVELGRGLDRPALRSIEVELEQVIGIEAGPVADEWRSPAPAPMPEAICPQCGFLATPEEVRRQLDPVQQPRGLTRRQGRLSNGKEGLELKIPWRGGYVNLLLLPTLVLDCLALAGLAGVVNDFQGNDKAAMLIDAVKVFFVVLLNWWVLSSWFNYTLIEVDDAELRVRYGPLPSADTGQSLGRSLFRQLYVEQTVVTSTASSGSSSGTSASYALRAKLVHGERSETVELINDGRYGRMLYLEQEIEKFLGIEDQVDARQWTGQNENLGSIS